MSRDTFLLLLPVCCPIQIPHWKGVSSAKAAMCIDHRAHALCRDVSRGAEEPATVPGVNEVRGGGREGE